MKLRVMSLMLVSLLAVPAITGCQMAQRVESAGAAVGRGVESVAETVGQALAPSSATDASQFAKPALSLEEAQNIALKHAGFTADQVTALRTEYEIERGIPQYDVEFRHGFWEYDYEIQGNTGEILSYSKDD